MRIPCDRRNGSGETGADEGVLEDAVTHRESWTRAFDELIRNADPAVEDRDDKAYWRHEKRALLRLLDLISDRFIPAAPAPHVIEAERLRKALNVACGLLVRHEPGDSRAVSDIFVALSAVASGDGDKACWDIVDAVSTKMQQDDYDFSPVTAPSATISIEGVA